MAVANGRIANKNLSALPKVFSNKRETEHLTTAAYASLVRMMLRATADTGSSFSIWDAYRSLTEQVSMLKRNYTRVSRGRRLSSDRSYGGSTWAKKSGRPLTASPGHSNHGHGVAIDIHPAAIQTWMRKNAARFGWVNDVPSEPWHWSYLNPGQDRYRSEGLPDVAAMQRRLGIEADGKPGPGTATAVRAYQKQHGLTVDGIAGPATMAAILGKDDPAPVIPSIPAGGTSVPTPQPNPARTELEPAVDGIFTWADSSTQFWDENYPGQEYQGGASKGLLHTTETGTWPGYGGGSSAPHLTIRFHPDTKTIEARQHFSTTRPSRALVNKTGGVQTNNEQVFQVELIGSCDRAFATKHSYHYLPTLLTEDWARDALAAMLAAVSASLGIPLTSSVSWAAYPGSYGERAVQRLTGGQWTAYEGWLGHQHAPENDHGDPGDLPVPVILAAAAGDPAVSISPPATSAPPAQLPTGKDALMALIAAPDFPLLRTPGHLCFYGPRTGPKESVSGHVSNSLNPGEVDDGAGGLKAWQTQMNARGYSLTVDGKYGDKTAAAAENLQRLAGITRDSLIGPDCWHAAYLLPVVS